MNAPALRLIPPSPIALDLPSSSPQSVGTSSSTESRTTASSHPHTTFTTSQEDRTSTETTIFSIYSMYGDDDDDDQPVHRSSWSPSAPVVTADRRSKVPGTVQPASLPHITQHRPSSYLSNASRRLSTELAYYGPDPDSPGAQPVIDLTVDGHDFSAPTVPSAAAARNSLRVSGPALRPGVTWTPSSSLEPPSSELLNGHKFTPPTNYRPNSFHALSPQPSYLSSRSVRPRSISPPSVRSSTQSTPQSSISIRDLPPLPPSEHSTSAAASQTSSSIHSFFTPRSSPRNLERLQSNAGSPSSKVSLVPSEGEDMDAFHVRQTYALLEVSGVKGDGYEEGVERTRARIGSSRESQMNAAAAVADGTEKSGDLHPQERQLLSTVDRYGFYSTPSHERLVLLSAAPLSRRLSPVSAGPPSATTAAISLKSLPPKSQPLKEIERIAKWTRMLQPLSRDPGGNVEVWGVRKSKEPKLRERVYKGIPDCWRSAVWNLLITQYAKMGHAEFAGLGREYRDGLDRPSKYDIQIDLDVPRTISGHVMFKTRYGAGQRSLFHVLHSFSLRCSTCGYVQGMGPIAATLLCYFEPERVYALLVQLHDAYSLHTIFSPGFPGLLEAIYVQEQITRQMMPGVYAAFKRHMVSTTSYATKWYITLFANSVPFQTQLRLWDVFLLEGYDLFIAVAVAIVWIYRDQITASSASFETVLSLLSSFFVPEDENLLLAWLSKTLGDKKLRANMAKWRVEWRRLVAEGKEGSALL